MYIIVGLGNPKSEYKNTRHNIGFDVIDVLSDKYDIITEVKKHRAFCGKGFIEGQKVVLAMPQTYMNLSGESVKSLVDYYKVDIKTELIVIFDDVSLDLGQLRIRKQGTAGGHNGMKNIISQLGTDEFMRVRMGVGEKPKGYDLADYVLGHFSKGEREIMDETVIKATEAIKVMVTDGADRAMNLYNKKNQE
ncbi:MAG TPA: aminoacyl-tRNA hydrolase [Lachnospiraceae bacterium]|nr:aminoacyl-tRNA hydrolase [Lachnospiraceae bacterium]